MNDFTKEELELIQNNLHWNQCAHTNQRLLQLNNKLKEMIHNYCEHEMVYDNCEHESCSKCGARK